jgi:hypothetical protein
MTAPSLPEGSTVKGDDKLRQTPEEREEGRLGRLRRCALTDNEGFLLAQLDEVTEVVEAMAKERDAAFAEVNRAHRRHVETCDVWVDRAEKAEASARAWQEKAVELERERDNAIACNQQLGEGNTFAVRERDAAMVSADKAWQGRIAKQAWVDQVVQERDAALAEVKRLRDLRHFADHTRFCERAVGGTRCDCGYEQAALAATGGAEE